MEKTYQAILLACPLLFLGCEKKEEEVVLDESFATAAVDLKKPEDSKLHQYETATDFQLALGEVMSHFEASSSDEEEDDEDEGSSESEDCFYAMLDKPIKASGESMTYSVEGDAAKCIGEEPIEGTTVTVNKARVQLFMYLKCKGGDLSGLNGKKGEDLTTVMENPCEGSSEMEMQLNSKMELDMGTKIESEGLSVEVAIAYEVIEATQTTSDKPCRSVLKDGLYHVENGCAEWVITRNFGTEVNGEKQPDSDKVEYAQITYNNLQMDDSSTSPWYPAGSFDVVMGNWTGAVTYSASDKAPTASFTDGTSTVEGDLTTLAKSESELTSEEDGVMALTTQALADKMRRKALAPYKSLRKVFALPRASR